MKCETVEIKGVDGKQTVINKEDFDPKKHELYNAPTKRGPKAKDSK
jgi:hypothetical protein